MSRRQLHIILGFLSAFVLISVAPRLADLNATGPLPDADRSAGLGNLLLLLAGGVLLSVGLIAARRRFIGRPRRDVRSRPATVARGGSARDVVSAEVSPLTQQLRKESDRGARVAELARQFGLSHDGVRSALGRFPTTPAARGGSSFRGRKPEPPAPARAKDPALQRSPYQTIA